MSLDEILRDPKFLLPLKNNSGKSFADFLENLFKDYLKALSANRKFLDEFKEHYIEADEFIQRVESYCTSIISTLRKHSSNQEESYKIFNSLMSGICPIFLDKLK